MENVLFNSGLKFGTIRYYYTIFGWRKNWLAKEVRFRSLLALFFMFFMVSKFGL